MVREYNMRDMEAYKAMEKQFLYCSNLLRNRITTMAGITTYKLEMEDYSDKWLNMHLPSLVKEERKNLGPFHRTKRTTMVSVTPARGYDCSFNILSRDSVLDEDLQHLAKEAEMMYNLVSINLVKI
jgi:hypothetical protein